MEFIEAFMETFITAFTTILQFIIVAFGFALPVIITHYTQNLWMLLSGIIIIPFSFGLARVIGFLVD